MNKAQIFHHQNDLPGSVIFTQSVAIDTETMGLCTHRDRLCVVQLSAGDGTCHVVQISKGQKSAPNLVKLLSDSNILKIFHFARFDLAILQHTFNITVAPVYCTKVASKLIRTFQNRHGLKNLCQDLLNIDLSKAQQSSDWGQADLTDEQMQYAASDVLYLHQLKKALDVMLMREGRMTLANKIYEFLPTCAHLDVLGYQELSVLTHH